MEIFCACRCGATLEDRDNRNRVRKFVYGHHRRGIAVKASTRFLKSLKMLGERNHRWQKDRNSVGRKGMNFTRRQIKELREDRCYWCGSSSDVQLDHVFPIFAGGDNCDSNAQTLCRKCNNKKRDIDYRRYRKLGEFGEHPVKGNTEPS